MKTKLEGFSLLEVLIVLTLISLIAGLLTPKVDKFISTYKKIIIQQTNASKKKKEEFCRFLTLDENCLGKVYEVR